MPDLNIVFFDPLVKSSSIRWGTVLFMHLDPPFVDGQIPWKFVPLKVTLSRTSDPAFACIPRCTVVQCRVRHLVSGVHHQAIGDVVGAGRAAVESTLVTVALGGTTAAPLERQGTRTETTNWQCTLGNVVHSQHQRFID